MNFYFFIMHDDPAGGNWIQMHSHVEYICSYDMVIDDTSTIAFTLLFLARNRARHRPFR